MSELTQEYLKEALNYDPETGVFVWRSRQREHFSSDRGWRIFNSRYAGAVAGSLDSDGYLCIKIGGKAYKAHRLAWLYVYGEFPRDQIDHINHARADNRVVNLRSVSITENHKNRPKSRNNTSGAIGVYWYKQRRKWRVQIGVNGKTVDLGYFGTLADAEAARKAAEIKYGFHQNHGAGL